jgi:CheY-like chemotaxis protein
MAQGKGTRSSSSGLQGLRVLVVEDGWQVADGLKLSLEQWGMIVAGPVATAREAQSLVIACRPDLAVVDVNLKGEMAYRLMDWLHDRGIQVVVISGYEDLPGSLAKFAAVLQKPFTDATLLTTLKRTMGPGRTP